MSRRPRRGGPRKTSAASNEAEAHARRYPPEYVAPSPFDDFGDELRRAAVDLLRSVLEQAARDFQPRPPRPRPPWAEPDFVPPPRARAGRARPRPAPAPEPTDDETDAVRAAAAVLGLEGQKLTPAIIRARRKVLAKKHHPDRPGGDGPRMAKINNAADFLLDELGDK